MTYAIVVSLKCGSCGNKGFIQCDNCHMALCVSHAIFKDGEVYCVRCSVSKPLVKKEKEHDDNP